MDELSSNLVLASCSLLLLGQGFTLKSAPPLDIGLSAVTKTQTDKQRPLTSKERVLPGVSRLTAGSQEPYFGICPSLCLQDACSPQLVAMCSFNHHQCVWGEGGSGILDVLGSSSLRCGHLS